MIVFKPSNSYEIIIIIDIFVITLVHGHTSKSILNVHSVYSALLIPQWLVWVSSALSKFPDTTTGILYGTPLVILSVYGSYLVKFSGF